MNQQLVKPFVFMLGVVGLLGPGRADVWQDCDYLLIGARDKNANGIVDNGELVNQMQGATDPGSATRIGTAGRLCFTNLNVATYSCYTQTVYGKISNPEWGGWTVTNRTCLYAEQPADGTCSIKSGYNPGVSNYTFLCRVRRDETNSTTYSYLLTTSLTKKDGTSGVVFRLGPGSSKNPISENGKYAGNKIHLYFGHGEYDFGVPVMFRNHRWVNLAVVVSNYVITVGVKDETMKKMAWESRDLSSDTYVTGCVKSTVPADSLYFFGTQYNTDKVSFHGAMQFAASWTRPLSQGEIVEAFSDRHPAIWRVGAEGRGADVFGGEPGRGVNKLPAAVPDWSLLPKAFSAGDSVEVPFDVQYEEDKLSQYVRLKGRSGSGVFRVSVDGVAYGEESVSAGRFAHFFIPRGVLTKSQAHSCTIARIDQGASDVSLDFYDMMGSFRVGLEDNSTNGTGGNGVEGETEYDLANANLLSFKTVLVPHSTNTAGGAAITGLDRAAYMIDIPADIASGTRFTYTSRWYDTTGVVGQRMVLKVNDAKTYEMIVPSGETTYTYKFRPGDLLPGLNRFEWSFPDIVPRYKADGATKIDYWYRCDYQRFEADPMKGIILVFR